MSILPRILRGRRPALAILTSIPPALVGIHEEPIPFAGPAPAMRLLSGFDGGSVAPLLRPSPQETQETQEQDDAVEKETPASKALEASWVETLAELEGGTGGLSVDAEGNVYSSEFGNWLGQLPPGETRGGTRVFKLSPDGEVSVFARGFFGASGSGISAKGEFFQSNIGAHFITRVDREGTLHRFCDEGIQNPVGIEVDPDGTLWVANCGSNSIQRISAEGKSDRFATGPLFQCPNGITRASDGNLYVANFGDGNVLRIDPKSEVKVLTTIPGNNNGHLVFAHGALWVAARSAHQIWRVELDGKKSLVAGTGERGGADGLPSESSFCFPNDLGFSPDGTRLYVNEVADAESKGQKLHPTRIRVIEFELE